MLIVKYSSKQSKKFFQNLIRKYEQNIIKLYIKLCQLSGKLLKSLSIEEQYHRNTNVLQS